MAGRSQGDPSGEPTVAPGGNARGRATGRRILEAATACFEERGVRLTLDEVAREAGTTRMTVHRHTGGREALITHLVLRASAEVAAALRRVLDDDRPFGERFGDALVVTVGTIRSTPPLIDLFTGTDPRGTWPGLDPEDRVMGAVHLFFRPYLEAAGSAGELRADPEATLHWALSQVLGFLMVPESWPDEAAVRRAVETFVVPAIARPTGEVAPSAQ